MTLYVMLNDGVCLGPVAAWNRGEKVLDFWAAGPQTGALICTGGGDNPDVPLFAALVYPMVPWSGTFFTEDGHEFKVQSFRCESLAGDVGYLLVCGECGIVKRADVQGVPRLGGAACERCSALPTPKPCTRFHTWGVCPECHPRVCEGSRSAFSTKGMREAAAPAAGAAEPKGGALGILAGSALAEPVLVQALAAGGLDRLDVSA